jgi:hypothetical protein
VARRHVGFGLAARSNGENGPRRYVEASASGTLEEWSPRVARVRDGAMVHLSVARCYWWSCEGHREDARQGGGGRGAPERWVGGEAVKAASGDGVQW